MQGRVISRTPAGSFPGRVGRGFTLIELLVVVAIIALLLAVLLPALARAREQAKQAACGVNTHQMALALSMYTVDNNYYPGHHLTFGRGDILWPVRLMRYTKKQHRTFWCPSAPPDTYWNGVDRIVHSVTSAGPDEFGSFAYGYNDWGVRETYAFDPPMLNLGLGGHINHPIDGEVKVDRVKRPSEMIAIADNESDGMWDTALDPYEEYEAPGDRHHKGANVVFCDSHAKWYLKDRLIERKIGMRQRWNNDFEAHEDLWLDGGPIP